VTITHTTWRAGLAALLATGVLVLGACGGGDDDAKDDETEEEASGDDASTAESDGQTSPTPSVNPEAPAADSDFCQGALQAMTAQVDPNDPSGDASLEAALALDAPDEIAEAWENVMTVARDMTEIDYNDPEAAAQAQAAYQEIADDQTKVMEYIQTDCGIGAPPPSSVPSAPTTGG
jgi:hypothetical protein